MVHCSAGIGRTGTFVAIDVVMKRLRHLDSKDIKGELPGFAECVCASLLNVSVHLFWSVVTSTHCSCSKLQVANDLPFHDDGHNPCLLTDLASRVVLRHMQCMCKTEPNSS